MTIAETFDQHYRKDISGCWVWLRALKGTAAERNNYGHLRVHGKQTAAHRFSYEREHGEGSAAGMQVTALLQQPSMCQPEALAPRHECSRIKHKRRETCAQVKS